MIRSNEDCYFCGEPAELEYLDYQVCHACGDPMIEADEREASADAMIDEEREEG